MAFTYSDQAIIEVPDHWDEAALICLKLLREWSIWGSWVFNLSKASIRILWRGRCALPN